MTTIIDNGGKQIWDCQGERCEMNASATAGYRFPVKQSYLEEVRICERCDGGYRGVLFSRTRHGKYCQRCSDEMDAEVERDLAIKGYRRRLRCTPLTETPMGPWRAGR